MFGHMNGLLSLCRQFSGQSYIKISITNTGSNIPINIWKQNWRELCSMTRQIQIYIINMLRQGYGVAPSGITPFLFTNRLLRMKLMIYRANGENFMRSSMRWLRDNKGECFFQQIVVFDLLIFHTCYGWDIYLFKRKKNLINN
ncbi:hypothetical protein D0466_04040 [Peribacillus glennii]|uniref:Uncharacterized protein n=1 Tax=Peribacillus glennii TaxID=2303991 RepID=A0A372LG92_9BACI|nr:hypothetical protein D0466_04040 [Peribacillus glennii]